MNDYDNPQPNNKSFWIGLAFVIVALVVFLVFAYLLGAQANPVTQEPVVPTYGVSSQTPWGRSDTGKYEYANGQSFTTPDTCIQSGRGQWLNVKGGTCQCIPPYFGPSCQYQTYATHYNDIGPMQRANWNLELGQNLTTEFLSWTKEACTQKCDLNDDCQGVLWTPSQRSCQLLNALPVIRPGAKIEYTTQLTPNQEQMLLRDNQLPVLNDRVILMNGTPQHRPWLMLNNNSQPLFAVQTIFPLNLVTVDWKPQVWLNMGQMTLIVAANPFGPLQQPPGSYGQNWIILNPGDDIKTLPVWPVYYMMAYYQNQLPNFITS